MTDEPEVTGADGSFYQNYKREFLELIKFVEQAGQDVPGLEKLSPADASQLSRYVRILSSKKAETFPLLAKRIDENHPTFLDECIVENVWQIAEAMFMIGQYSALNGEGARKYVKAADTGKARDEKARSDKRVKDRRLEVLRRFIGDRVITAYSKFVTDELAAINTAAVAARLEPASRTTWVNLMKDDLGYGSTRKRVQD